MTLRKSALEIDIDSSPPQAASPSPPSASAPCFSSAPPPPAPHLSPEMPGVREGEKVKSTREEESDK